MRIPFFCVMTAALGASACDRVSVSAVHGTSYQCAELAVSAEFPDSDTAKITFDDRTLTLKRAVSASGARYADEAGNEFWTKDGAMLTVAGQPMRQCKRAGGS